MGFENVTAAKKGSTDVLRIYQNDVIVYNKYDWEKWNAVSETYDVYTRQYSLGASYPITQTPASAFLTAYFSESNRYTILFEAAPSGYTVLRCVSEGYIYIPIKNNLGANRATIYDELNPASINIAMPNSSESASSTRCEVVFDRTATRYVKGATSYGVVRGYAGDYPDNGRHSDGFWYTRQA